MASEKEEWPETGELVVATVNRVTSYGAYVMLDEYGREGLLHISEISSTWVRNIRDFIREKQKVVLKVLQVDSRKGHVNLSLRRVSKVERREKNRSWKKDRRAETLLSQASEKLGIPIEEMNEKAGFLIEKEFGGLYEGLEKTANEGATILTELGIPKDIATTLENIAKERIRAILVKRTGLLELECTKPNGAVIIRDALLRAQKIKTSEPTKIRVYTVSPPSYRIEVLAENYKEAETLLQKAADTALQAVTKLEGRGVFRAEK
ncbi:MAG: translation initiation factor IF-2 subunit alpha [Candidatus Bathyarchaeota archaeon]|nr:MAG: translation initiation factor IF-2 subunit alpha [Candidatus Bathyarchaeota archaeon]